MNTAINIEKNEKPEVKFDKLGRVTQVGKRKRSIARVWVKPSTKLNILIKKGQNKFIGFSEHFPLVRHSKKLENLLKIVNLTDNLEVMCTLHGGGITGQIDALIHALAKGLVVLDPELRTALKSAGYLRRDSRRVEPKKIGKKKARRSPQFSKR
jgi:small subunit ribosomal protein S9